MKTNFKIALLMGVLALVLFIGCHDDDLNKSELVTTQETIKVSSDDLLRIVKDPEIKKSIIKNKSITKSIEEDYFTKVHMPEYDTYTLLIDDYTTDKPYYKFFVVTVDNNIQKSSISSEMGFYTQYVPTQPNYDPSGGFDIGTFVGTLNIHDLNLNLVGSAEIFNGSAMGIVTICNTRVAIKQMTCSHSGEHGVGDTCKPPLINDAYYTQIDVETDCFDRITFIGGASSGTSGGGGGVSYVEWFYSTLNGPQKIFMDVNSGFRDKIYNFLNKFGGADFGKRLIDYAIKNGNSSLDSFFEGWDGLNGPERAKFKDYLNKNNNSKESFEFIIWATEYMKNNPTVTIEKFENIYMIPREGQDWEYNSSYWDNPNLSFPQQNLPSWQKFKDNYPSQNSEQIYPILGGELAQLRIDYPNQTRNGCAVKVSAALNKCSILIPDVPGTFKDKDGLNYFVNAKELNKWMRETFGTNPATSTTPLNEKHHHFTGSDGGVGGENWAGNVEGMKGIFSLVSTNNAWASGHADILFENGTCKAGCHFLDVPPAPIDYIDIWILE